MLGSESDKLAGPEKGTPALSHASAPVFAPAPTPAKIQTPKYTKADLLRILKIFLETKGQELKPEVSRKRPLKAKVLDMDLGKSYMDSYHFCQQWKDHFETARDTGLNRILFAALFLGKKINF